MSEQFAIQPEEFDSTNERLDSILDRLNALGQSASATKTATKRSLESVPSVGADEPGDVITAPNDNQAPNGIHVAATPLGLVPPIDDDEPTVRTEDELDDAFDGEAFSDLQVVDTGAEYESVTVVESVADSDVDVFDEPEALDIEPVVLDDELPPVDLEIPEAGWTEVGNYEVETADPASEITDHDIALEEAALKEAAHTEAVVAELAQADLFEAQETIDPAPAFETEVAPPATVDETVVETPDIFAPAPAEAAEADVFAAVEEAPVETPEAEVAEQTPLVAPANEAPTEPIEVEFHEMELTPDPVAHIESQVFELDASDMADPTPSTLPDSPQSIFSSSLGSGSNKSEPAATDETDGWISHHGPSEQPAPFAQMSGDSDSEIASTSSYDAASDPQWEIDPPMSGSIFDQDAATASTEIADDPFAMANEVERTLDELELEATDSFTTGDAEMPMVATGIDSSLVETDTMSFDVLSTGVDEDPNLYTSDDELPLPDFTGVYDGDEAESKSGSVESTISSSLSVGRHELDSLRPIEDPEDSVLIADVQEKRDLSGIVQFSFVVFIGIAALVMYWVLDPTALADMQANLDNLLGR